MMDELYVKDIMEKPRCLFCGRESSMESIVKRLVKMEDLRMDVDVIVVKDEKGLAGIMFPIDIFNALLPSGYNLAKGYGAYEIFWKGMFTLRCKRLSSKRVEQYMQEPEGLKPDDNLMRAANYLVKKKVDTALVLKEKELVGLIRSRKLFRLMSLSVSMNPSSA